MFDCERPFAEVTRVGRWTYRVIIRDGITLYGPDGFGWTVLGSERAKRKARGELERYLRKDRWAEDTVVVE